MPKPLHPTTNSIKAGQTIYLVSSNFHSSGFDYFVHPISIVSKNEQPPFEGEVVNFAPVDWLKRRMSEPSYHSDPYAPFKEYFFHSKRKAMSHVKQLLRGDR